MQKLRRVSPSPIQIHSQNVASVVTFDDAVWIKHGHYLEDEKLPQSLSFFRVWL